MSEWCTVLLRNESIVLHSNNSGTLLHPLACPSKCVCVCLPANKLLLPLALSVVNWVLCMFANLTSIGQWNQFVLQVITLSLGMLMLFRKPLFRYRTSSTKSNSHSWSSVCLSHIPLSSSALYLDDPCFCMANLQPAPCCRQTSWQSFSSNAVLISEGPRGKPMFLLFFFFIVPFFFFFKWALQSQRKKSQTVNVHLAIRAWPPQGGVVQNKRRVGESCIRSLSFVVFRLSYSAST